MTREEVSTRINSSVLFVISVRTQVLELKIQERCAYSHTI